jgi:hypothetical protein
MVATSTWQELTRIMSDTKIAREASHPLKQRGGTGLLSGFLLEVGECDGYEKRRDVRGRGARLYAIGDPFDARDCREKMENV